MKDSSCSKRKVLIISTILPGNSCLTSLGRRRTGIETGRLGDLAYFTPTPATDRISFTLANYSGTGMIYFEDGARPGIIFRPNYRTKITDVNSIFINIDPGDDPPDKLLLSMECVTIDGKWNTPERPMEFQELFIGENQVIDIEGCIDEAGVMNLLFWNNSSRPIALKNISVEVDFVFLD